LKDNILLYECIYAPALFVVVWASQLIERIDPSQVKCRRTSLGPSPFYLFSIGQFIFLPPKGKDSKHMWIPTLTY